MSGSSWIDADTHIYEDVASWGDHVESRFRDFGPKLVNDDRGRRVLSYAGATYPTLAGHPGFGAIYDERGRAARGMSPAERLAYMDSRDVDVEVVYPTLGLNGVSQIRDPQLAGSLARAYNRYAAGYSSADPRRLAVAAIVPMNHPEVAVRELEFARELGISVAVSNPTPPDDIAWSDPRYQLIWSALQDLNITFTLHELTASAPVNTVGIGRFFANWSLMYVCTHVVESMLAVTDLILSGVLQRFPRLRVGMAECHVAWIPGWFVMLDDQYRTDERGGRGRLADPPSEYFRRQCYVAAFGDDSLIPEALRFGGNVTVCTDWPHPPADVQARRELTHVASHEGLSGDERRAILVDNGRRFLGRG